jgi:hypothetical protein
MVFKEGAPGLPLAAMQQPRRRCSWLQARVARSLDRGVAVPGADAPRLMGPRSVRAGSHPLFPPPRAGLRAVG